MLSRELDRYPVLLPIQFEDGPQELRHLRLHNGTIWRWNRLLIGFDEAATPHLRVEHRVMPAGPTIVDMIANAALYLGASRFPCGIARCARSGSAFLHRARQLLPRRAGRPRRSHRVAGRLAVTCTRFWSMRSFPMAREGLKLLGADEEDIERYLDVAEARVRTGQNGAAWQRAHIERKGRDFFRLTADYLEHQRSAMPVHEWPL